MDDDDALTHFTHRMLVHYGLRDEAPRHQPTATLRAVTADNAHEFVQPVKRCGRPPKVRTGGNVVALRARAKPTPANDHVDAWMREMVEAAEKDRQARRLARAQPIGACSRPEGGSHD